MTLGFVALTPVVWMPLLDYFHPQDLVAVGLIVGGMACVERRSWTWAGIVLGLATASQQYALLALAPIVVIAPPRGRWQLIVSCVSTWLIVVIPIVVITSGQAWHGALIGSGNFPSYGGTVVWELHLHGALLVFFSRVLPILIAAALGWWASRHFGPSSLDSVRLASLVATCVSLRLVFEQNLFGYYFMALAVLLIILEASRGFIRGTLVAWLAMVTLVFNPIPAGFDFNARSWGNQVYLAVPAFCLGVVLLFIVSDAFQHRIRWYLAGWFVLGVIAFGHWPPWATTPYRHALPLLFWQVLLVGTGLALAAKPLAEGVRDNGRV